MKSINVKQNVGLDMRRIIMPLVIGLGLILLFLVTLNVGKPVLPGFKPFILFLGYIVGFYMAWNIGANDVANSMASAVGAKAITIKQAVIIAGILNVVGAVFIGSHVTNTIRKGIITAEVMSDPHIALLGALSALLASALWITFASWKSLPVSTTHSIVGAMIGFGIVAGGFSVVQWGKVGAVVASWIISPFLSMVIGWTMYKIITRFIVNKEDAFGKAIKYSPYFIGAAIFIIVLSFLFKTPLGKDLALTIPMAIGIAFAIATITGMMGQLIFKKFVPYNDGDDAEPIFKRIQIGTSCYVALAHGANDVANAIGPLAVIYFIVTSGSIGSTVSVPPFLLFFGGIGIALGIWMWGYRVMSTVGEKITPLNNTRGFSVDFAAATTVLVASKFGLPVSTTHSAVGGVMGVGMSNGKDGINFHVIGKIVLYWILTVPAAAITSMIIFNILQKIF